MTLRGYVQMDIRLDPVKLSIDFKGFNRFQGIKMT